MENHKNNIEKENSKLTSSDELIGLSIEIGETLIDSILNDGLLKDVPILSSINGLIKVGTTFRDNLLAKKIYKFLFELQSTSYLERQEFITKIAEDQSYESKVGETLILLLDKSDDMKKSSLIGKLFSAAIQEKISYTDFLKLSSIINRSFVPTIAKLKSSNLENSISKAEYEELFSLGLVTLNLENDLGNVRRSFASENRRGFALKKNEKPESFNQKIKYQLSENGKLLIKVLFQ